MKFYIYKYTYNYNQWQRDGEKLIFQFQKEKNTRLNRSSARPAMALPRTIIWLQGSSFPLTDDVNG